MTENTVTIPQNQMITYQPSRENFAISRQDWERVKHRLEIVKQRKSPKFHVISSFCFGVAASFGTVLVSLYGVGKPQLWAALSSWAILAFSIILGGLFIYVDTIFRGEQKSDIEEALDDMKNIEANLSTGAT